jgi:xanthosine utilization system XapX-like protein
MMDFLKQVGLALLGGWISAIAFGWLKLPAPVPPCLGLVGASGGLIGGDYDKLLIRILARPECCPMSISDDRPFA